MHIPHFNAEQAETLKLMCSDKVKSQYLHDYHFIHGQIFAIAAAPEIPMPQEWMMWVFKDPDMNTSSADADALTGLLMSLFQYHLRQMRDESVALPDFCSLTERQDENSPLSLWCQGVLSVHQQLEPIWQQAWDRVPPQGAEEGNKLSKSLHHALSMFSTFANIPLALTRLPADKSDELAERLGEIYQALPQALKGYVDVSGSLAGYLPDQFETFKQQAE